MQEGKNSPTELAVGRIDYVNVLPVYYALEQGAIENPFSLKYAPPSQLNILMEQGALLASSTSSVEYAKRPDKYSIIENLGIVSKGAVQSVALLSQQKVETLNNATIMLTKQSHTSIVLLRLLLEKYVGITVQFSEGDVSAVLADSSAEKPMAVLAIGDEALQLQSKKLFEYCWDLGDAWHAWTNLPFVYGLWIAQKNMPQEQRDILVSGLHASRDWGLQHSGVVIQAAVERSLAERPFMTADFLEKYFAGLYYSLGPKEEEGLLLFYKHLASMGEIDHIPTLVYT